MTHRRLAWSVALVIPLATVLASMALSDANGPDRGGVVRVPPRDAMLGHSSRPSSPAVPVSPAKRLAIVVTQEDADLASSQSLAVQTERRDPAWAARSEAAIASQMRRIAYIGGTHRLDIRCAATLCEVVGVAEPDPVTHAYQPIWEALERDTAGTDLRAHGLERVAAIFDTGRSPEEFKLQYRRVGPLDNPRDGNADGHASVTF